MITINKQIIHWYLTYLLTAVQIIQIISMLGVAVNYYLSTLTDYYYQTITDYYYVPTTIYYYSLYFVKNPSIWI